MEKDPTAFDYFISFVKVTGDIPGPIGTYSKYIVGAASPFIKSDSTIMKEHFKKVEKQLERNVNIINDNLRALSNNVRRVEKKMNKVLDGLNDI